MDLTLKPWLAALGLVALAGCAGGDGRYPSLAKRPVESAMDPVTGQFMPVEPAAPAPAPPIRPEAGPAALASLEARALEAHQQFLAAEPAAARLARAASGTSPDSDAHARAVVAISSLTSQRGATSAALADLDLIAAEAATSLAPTATIDAARSRVLALVEAEDAALARLWEEMGR